MVGPGGTPPTDIDSIDAHAMVIGREPLLVLAARYRATQIGPLGELVAEDGVVAAARALGARPVESFVFAAGELTPGWHVRLTTVPGLLRVTAPDRSVVYDGTLAPGEVWLDPVRQDDNDGTGLPVVICSAGTADDALERIATGRAVWVRASLTVH